MSQQIQLQQVTTKDPKKVKAGKRLAEWNHRNIEKLAQLDKAQESEPNLTQACGNEAIIAVGVFGLLGCYIYPRGSPGDKNAIKVTPVRSVEIRTLANKFEME